ncbi:MAG: hypothetical protein V2J08_13915 [Desulfotignum sp.]|jgi:hypothetical protein|nr:hypothetical protein [Desulfotignum sp.]
MQDITITDNWYYVIIQNPGTLSEEVLGFSNETTKEKFLPAFKTKQDAKSCFELLPKDLFKKTYDIHAVIEEDIIHTAQKAGHQVFVLDEKGHILKPLG